MVACGLSGWGQWPHSGMITSFAPAMPSAISLDSVFGISMSSSPVSTSVGHLMVAIVGRESTRAITAILSSRRWFATVTGPNRHRAGMTGAYIRADDARPGTSIIGIELSMLVSGSGIQAIG